MHNLKRENWQLPVFGLDTAPGKVVRSTCGVCGAIELISWKCLRGQVNRRAVLTSVRMCNGCYLNSAEHEAVCDVFRTIDYKQHQSQASSIRWKNEEYRERYRATRSTQEYRQAASHRSLKMWSDDLYRNRVSEALRLVWSDQDKRMAMSETMKKVVSRESYRETQRLTRSTPEYRAKQSEISKSLWRSERFRQRMSTMSRQLWSQDKFRQHMAVMLANQPRESSLQHKLYAYLDDLGVEYKPEGDETVFGPWTFDCFIPAGSGGLLIECQGDYWHSLPRQVRNDRSKFTYISRYFPEYSIMYVWEHEFLSKDRVLDRLKQKLGLTLESVPFELRDVSVVCIENDVASKFLESYHYLRAPRGGKAFGAMLGDKLVAVATLSRGVRQNSLTSTLGDDARELSRFCIHPSYHRKNFASWLIARFIKLSDHGATVAYADTTVGHIGTMYRAAGFHHHHQTDPDYWYVDDRGWVMHKKSLYNMARRMSMTEAEWAAKIGYHKRWGGNKICFVRPR